MKKNLFLTLALLLASLVGVNAQDWSMTLNAHQGLPGFKANKGEGVENLKTYKSSVIRPGKAIDGFRFTVIETEYDKEKADGVQFFYLGEFSVYDLNGNKLNYTVTSNACHNTITGGNDGGGLAALNDGDYTTYFHSVWEGGHNVTENHYLEFTFEAPISEFVVEWNARSGKQYMPTIVGLTEKGVKYLLNADFDYTLGDKLTTLDAVKSAAYVTILGNADTLYTQYDHEKGEIDTDDDNGTPMVNLKGEGKLYFAGNAKKAAEADVTFTAQLIPTEDGDGTVYVYFPYIKRYVNADATDNQYGADAQNGWQTTTALKEKAAKVTLTPVGDGDFTMHYTAEIGGAGYVTYIAADPRGNFKIFSEARKEGLEEKGWCYAFGIKCNFNFSFFNTEYEAPTWGGEFLLGYTYHYAKSLYDLLGTEMYEDVDGLNAEALANFEAAMPAAWSTVTANEGLEDEEYSSQAKDLQDAIGRFVEAKVNTAYMAVTDEMKDYANKLSATPKKDCYPEDAYNEFILNNIITNGENLYNRGIEENPYDYLNELLTYLNSIEANIEDFLDSKYIINTLPVFFGEKVEGTQGKALGTKVEKHYEWTEDVYLDKAVNGFRITFLANHAGGNNSGFPMIALAELEVVDAEGNELALDETLVTTNSLADNEGEANTIAAMFDDDKATYYHSFWGGGRYDPKSHVYLDVKFPEGISLANFTLKTVSRNNDALAPAYVAMTNYAEAFDPKLNMPNDYNVVLGKKVTDPEQLKDGGLYVISGNLRVNKEENPSVPRYYSGITPYHHSEVAAANDACVYMLKKVGDGWNIVSLANAQYWTEEAGLTSIQKDAAVIKVAKSTNIEGAVVLYSDMEPEVAEAGFKTDSVVVETDEIVLTKRVYMDWDGGLEQRPCQNVLPGVFEYGYDVLKDYPNLINESAFGDNVHFNKTNGEGEWNIYEVTMDDPYYRWLLAALPKLNELGLVPGTDPGCVVTTPEVEAAFNSAKAAAAAAVEAEERANAETLVNDLVDAVNSLAVLEVIKIKNKGYYRIESAVAGFAQNFNGVTKSMYVDENTMKLMWGATPAELSWKTSEYFFQFIFLDEEAQIDFSIFPEGDEAPYSYVIYNDKTQSYISEYNADSRVCLSKIPTVYIVKPFAGNEFMIYKSGDEKSKLHANQHGNGKGSGSDILYYNAGSGSASAWYLRTVDEKATSISDLVVEGDEVVSVSYFTPAGAAIATPVKGINIVVIVYNNGVVETKKVLVK